MCLMWYNLKNKQMKNLAVSILSKTKLTISILLIAFTAITFTSCEDYPEGPAISLISKTNRVANNWRVAQALNDGVDVTADYDKYELNLSKTGTAELIASYSILGSDFEFTTNGTWAFVNDSEKISFDYDNNDASGVYVIIKLKEDEMWLKEDGGTTEIHYVTR
jgi:hypothetical protein